MTRTSSSAPRIGGIIGYVNGSSSAVSTLENLTYKGVIDLSTPQGGYYIGGVAGFTTQVKISNCVNEAQITINNTHATSSGYVGGIAAQLSSNAEMYSCRNLADITCAGANRVGGVTAYTSTATSKVAGCANFGDIVAGGYNSNVGGVTAYMSNGSIESSYNSGNIVLTASVTGSTTHGVGGVVGYIATAKPLKACYSTGTITPASLIGQTKAGLVCGRYYGTTFDYSMINACYYAGTGLASDIDSNVSERVIQFSGTNWPDASTDGWGTGNGTNGKYWKDLGADGVSYPTLWWEE